MSIILQSGKKGVSIWKKAVKKVGLLKKGELAAEKENQ